METRAFNIESLEIRADGDKRTIRGHAAVFETVADGGWFLEKVARGAFADSLAADDIRALWNHDSSIVLGRNRAGTLRLIEDDKGLAIEIDTPDTQMARDLLVSIERGDVSQMSFGFEVRKDAWEKEFQDGKDLRVLERVKLWEVSPVTFPFYKDTDVAVRSHERWVNEVERSLVPPTIKNKLRKRLSLRKKLF